MTEELEARLGRSIRTVRVAQRRTQLELAELANISVGALKHLETGAGSTTATLVKVLKALGREDWLDTLAPAPDAFNPLALLEARQKEARRVKGPPRVRHRATRRS
jgi:transcriptional regulator with XRE-family HTH domain